MHPILSADVPVGKLAVHWFGQSSFALKSPSGTIVLIDPYFPHERPAEKFVHATPPLDESELPVQGVLLTHDHSDHTHPESLVRIHDSSPGAVFAGPMESCSRLSGAGIDESQIVVVQAGSSQTVSDLTAHFVFAKPPEGDPDAEIAPPDVTHLGIVVECGDTRVYFSGDPINNFDEHDSVVNPVKELAPQIGWLTCHPSEGEFPFFDGCVKMADRAGLEQVFPSHYDCFVKRTYDPADWAAAFPADGPLTRVVDYNSMVVVP